MNGTETKDKRSSSIRCTNVFDSKERFSDVKLSRGHVAVMSPMCAPRHAYVYSIAYL